MDMNEIAVRWSGAKVPGYEDRKRRKSPEKWDNEHLAIAEILREIGPGKSVLDMPVGTGRLIELYQHWGQTLTGVDVSDAMLECARTRAAELEYGASFHRGDLRAIPFPDQHFDIVVCMSFLSWITRKDLEQTLRELSRVARSDLIVGARNVGPLRRMGLGSLGRLVKRQTLRTLRPLRKGRAGRKPLIPFKRSLALEFQRAGLEVKRRVVVERRSDGTEGAVYWLKRKAH